MATYFSKFSAGVLDVNGVKATVTAYANCADSTTIAQVHTEWQAWLEALSKVTDAEIVSAHFAITPTLPGDLPDVGAASFCPATAVIDFGLTGTQMIWGFAIASIYEEAIVDGKLNLLDTNVQALNTLMLTPVTGITFCDNKGLPLASVRDGFQTSRKRRHMRVKSI